jgi:hypothetical protein
MSLLDKIKLPFLRQPAQTNQHEQPAPAEPAMKTLNVLDRAIDVLERPDIAKPAPVLLNKTPERTGRLSSPEQIEADKIRAELRADTARRMEENRQNEIKRNQERLEANKRPEEKAAGKANTWEAQYKPYCGREVAALNVITKQFLAKLITFGKLQSVRAECAARVAPLLDSWDVAFEARAKTSRAEFRKQFLEDIEENATRLREGNSNLRTMQNPEAYERQFSIVRSQCRERQLEISKQVNPVILELADKLQTVARRLCNERFVMEKAEAESYGMLFEPSSCLKYLVMAGFDLRGCVERNFLSSQLSSPREALFGLLDPNTKW